MREWVEERRDLEGADRVVDSREPLIHEEEAALISVLRLPFAQRGLEVRRISRILDDEPATDLYPPSISERITPSEKRSVRASTGEPWAIEKLGQANRTIGHFGGRGCVGLQEIVTLGDSRRLCRRKPTFLVQLATRR